MGNRTRITHEDVALIERVAALAADSKNNTLSDAYEYFRLAPKIVELVRDYREMRSAKMGAGVDALLPPLVPGPKSQQLEISVPVVEDHPLYRSESCGECVDSKPGALDTEFRQRRFDAGKGVR